MNKRVDKAINNMVDQVTDDPFRKEVYRDFARFGYYLAVPQWKALLAAALIMVLGLGLGAIVGATYAAPILHFLGGH